KGEAEIPRDAKHDGADAKDRHRGEHRPTDPAVDRPAGQVERRESGADRGSAAQEAEPPRTDVQDIPGIDRQEGDRSTQQYREKIERDRSKHDRPRTDERYTLADPREAARERRRVGHEAPAAK